MGTAMQTLDKNKQKVKGLEANYRPIGPRHLLAAALAMRARDPAKKSANQDGKHDKIRVA
jgi:hypothetical protein